MYLLLLQLTYDNNKQNIFACSTCMFAYCYKCQSLTSLLPSYVICLQLTVISEFDNVTLLPSYFKVFKQFSKQSCFLFDYFPDQSALDQRPATPSTPPVEAAHTESPPSSSLLRPAVRQPLGQLSINVTLAGASFKLPSPPHATRRERGNPSLHSPRSPPVAVGRQSLSPLHSPQSPPVIIRGRNLSPFHSPQSSPVIVRRENLNPLHSPQSPPSVVVGRQNVSPLHSPRSAPVVVRRENLNSIHSPPSPSVLVGRGTVNLPAVRNTLSPPQVTRQRTLDEMTNTVSTKTSPVSDGSELGVSDSCFDNRRYSVGIYIKIYFGGVFL